MKPIILIAGLAVIGLAPHKTNAQVIVEDPAAIAQNAVQHAIDLGKYVEMISKQVEQIKAARNARAIATSEEALTLKARLEEKAIRLNAKAGVEGRLFGAIKTADVANAIVEAGLGEVDKRKIELAAPIKVAGNHSATVRLHSDVVANITIQVVGKK